MSAIEPPGPLLDATDQSIAARRGLLTEQGIDFGNLAPGQLGIAFSGGGIRSATISLGVAQALAKQDRLLDFDYMSTVSGGGYFGSFLRSLFLPQSARGSDATPDSATATKDDTDFALEVLKSEPDATMTGTRPMRNPVRWLRENSRYLAPAGPTDYAVAATYIIRNWLAMLCVFALPTLMFFLLIEGLAHGVALLIGVHGELGFWTLPHPVFNHHLRISKIIFYPGVLLVVSLVLGAANWLTVFTSDRWLLAREFGATITPARRVYACAAFALVAGVILVIFGVYNRGQPVPCAPDSPDGIALWLTICGGTSARLVVVLSAIIGAGAVASALVAIGATMLIERTEPKIGNALFGNELRRVLTSANTRVNLWMAVLLVLALIDTCALAITPTTLRWNWVAPLTVIGPLARWLIQKLQASFGKSSPVGSFGKFVVRYTWQVALVAAALLWGGFAALLDGPVRAVAYAPDGQWLPAYLLSFTILAVAIAVIGGAVGFINLSSLHSLYAARLTRAYVGASNHDRLKRDGAQDITGYQTKDVILADIYQQQCCAAPLHLMNVTLNETISATGSQLLERDRKGVPMVIAPEGIWIDAAAAAPARTTKSAVPTCSWADFAASKADPFSVGQITAISGAAASSAMGSRTTLGGALLFTYANIRLGYWWHRGTIRIDPDPAVTPPRDWLRWTGTFGYLLREMTARYRSTTDRVNLSDGGHFDDSGVYELLRRKVPTIVYCDNGEDAGYHFEDLEILVRKARLDIGVSVEVASPGDVLATLGMGGARIFLNGRAGDWRARARTRNSTDPAFALLLLVRDAACVQIGTIVLLKPSLFGALPADVWGYAEQHTSFPHEATSDQFFTEAQWESYRKLGFMMMQQMLGATPHQADLFRKL